MNFLTILSLGESEMIKLVFKHLKLIVGFK
jgi:hypothetical protein